MRFFVSMSLVVLASMSANAGDSHLKCSNGKITALVTLSAQSTYTRSTANECNAGVGDEPTGCHQVITFYEHKAVAVVYPNGSQDTQVRFEAVNFDRRDSKYSASHPLFEGMGKVQINNNLMDQISLSANSSNPFEYSLGLIRIAGRGPTSQNLGFVGLPCKFF